VGSGGGEGKVAKGRVGWDRGDWGPGRNIYSRRRATAGGRGQIRRPARVGSNGWTDRTVGVFAFLNFTVASGRNCPGWGPAQCRCSSGLALRSGFVDAGTDRWGMGEMGPRVGGRGWGWGGVVGVGGGGSGSTLPLCWARRPGFTLRPGLGRSFMFLPQPTRTKMRSGPFCWDFWRTDLRVGICC
jgi:hypothetical protein